MKPLKKRQNNRDQLGYSIASAAEALDVGRSSIYQLIADGKLKTIKVGTRTIVTGASLKALAEAA
jgi:excisionase family DNA binding protein